MVKHGIAASQGIVIGKVMKIYKPKLEITKNKISDVDNEIEIFRKTVGTVISELHDLRKKTVEDLDEELAKIFDAHIEFADDPELQEQVEEIIKNDYYNSAYALQLVHESFIELFSAMGEGYAKERVADLNDVVQKITSKLLGFSTSALCDISEPVIIVAEDLSPSDTVSLDRDKIIGIVTEKGSKTSHTAILSRSKRIPSVLGVSGIMKILNDGDEIIVDGIDGNVILEPNQTDVTTYREKMVEFEKLNKIWTTFATKKTLSKDLKPFEIAANISGVEDLKSVLEVGAEGIGLFRTEFLYMDKNRFPSENEQFQNYKAVLETVNPHKVLIRTLDIGGDKKLDYLQFEEELNPFLGHRAIRYCLSNKKIFKTQLRALIKASKYGNLHIMFPMIATLEELREAKAVLEECKQELVKENPNTDYDYSIGMMVEIPSAALIADQFAKEVDFVSIGTNDLIQYTFAADRMNSKLSYLYQPLHPSVLRLIKMVVDAAHNERIWVGVCGEMASDSKSIPTLLRIGVDELSMNASSILSIRHLVSEISTDEIKNSEEFL